jgi:heptose I phosphotransferase
MRLARHGVAVPRVLAMGQRKDGPLRQESFLLIEPAAASIRLDAWLARTRGATRKQHGRKRRLLLRQAGALLRRLHEAGCYLAPGVQGCVFAVLRRDDGRPYLGLDGADGLRPARRGRPDLARRDVAHFRRALAEAGCGPDEVAHLLDGYRPDAGRAGPPPPAERAAATEPPSDAPPPEDPVPQMQGSMLLRLISGGRRLVHRYEWPWFAGDDWLDDIMTRAVTDRFHAKQGRSTGRLVLPGRGRPPAGRRVVYLKRHYQLSWWRGWLATLWPRADWSPAMQEWRHLEWARRQGVPVPRPLAAAEFIGPWGRLQSVLAVEELTGMLPLHEAIPLAARRLAPDVFRPWKRTLIEEVARLTRLLHDRRCFHKDLYLCHFYIPEADTHGLPATWRNRVHLIDLHRLAHHPWTWRVWQVKDLAQLLYSSAVEGVEAGDRLWFWWAYLGPGPRTRDRWVRHWVLWKWRRYARHNARRQRLEEQEGTGNKEQGAEDGS